MWNKDKEDKHKDEHIEKKQQGQADVHTEKKEKEKLVELENKVESLSIKEFIKGEEKIEQAFQKIRQAEDQTRSTLELTTTIKTDFQLEILAIAFAVLLYYFGSYFWN